MHKHHTSKGRRAVQPADHQPRRAHRDRQAPKRALRSSRRPPQRKPRPRTAAEFELLLASEGMPAELQDLPDAWVVDEPLRDGIVRGDPLERRWGHEAAAAALDAQSARGAFEEIDRVLREERLSRRERAVLTLFAEGHGRWEIAKRLVLTREAVRWCLGQMRERYRLRFCRLYTGG